VRLRLIFATLGALVCLALVPAASLGQSLSDDAYTNQGGQVLSTVAGGNGGGGDSSGTAPVATTSSSTSSGVLPFTGLQLAIIGFAGIALLGSGVALRRAHR